MKEDYNVRCSCNVHDQDQKCIINLDVIPERKSPHMRSRYRRKDIVLMQLNKEDMKVWTRFIWLKVKSFVTHCKKGSELSCSVKGIEFLEGLSHSQEGPAVWSCF